MENKSRPIDQIIRRYAVTKGYDVSANDYYYRLYEKDIQKIASQFTSPSVNEEIIKKQDELIEKLIKGFGYGFPHEIGHSALEADAQYLYEEIKTLRSDQQGKVTDKDIEAWAKGTLDKYKEVELGVTLTDSDIREFIVNAKITGAKAMRDGKINHS
jgi:hypothetical protein